jgi:hypothetical protein
MACYHVALMKLIDIEVEAESEKEAKAIAIAEYSDGKHNDSFENTGVQISFCEKLIDRCL